MTTPSTPRRTGPEAHVPFNELSLDAGKSVGYTDHRHTDSAGAGQGPGRPGTMIDQSEADTHGPLHSCSLPQMSRVGLRRAACSDLLKLFEIHRAVFLPHIARIWGWDERWQRANFLEEMATASTWVPQVDNELTGYLQVQDQAADLPAQHCAAACASRPRVGTRLWSSSRRRRPHVICPSSSASSGRTWRQGASTSASGSSRRKAGKPIST